MATTQAMTQNRLRAEHFGVQRQPRRVNVGETERWLSVLGGGALAILGLSRESLPGLAVAAVGGSLVYRGLTGHCSLYRALGLDTAAPARRRVRRAIAEDPVAEASEESFPASDPPQQP